MLYGTVLVGAVGTFVLGLHKKRVRKCVSRGTQHSMVDPLAGTAAVGRILQSAYRCGAPGAESAGRSIQLQLPLRLGTARGQSWRGLRGGSFFDLH